MENYKLKKLFIILIILITGCQSTPRTIDLPDPNELHELLHIGENYAYKSITIKDFIVEDECNGKG
jgi:starvation-inducible outer membrane lipoprotein